MRPRTFRQLMHRLALVAAFALVLVPTLGRFSQAYEGMSPQPAAQAHAGHAMPPHPAPATEMHAHAGHGTHAHAGHATPESPLPSRHHEGSGDCDYCPLLQGLVAPGAVLLGSAIALAPAAPIVRLVDAHFDAPYPTGLGSRGPPIA